MRLFWCEKVSFFSNFLFGEMCLFEKIIDASFIFSGRQGFGQGYVAKSVSFFFFGVLNYFLFMGLGGVICEHMFFIISLHI